MPHLTYVVRNPDDFTFEPQETESFAEGKSLLQQAAALGIVDLVLELHHSSAVRKRDFSFPQGRRFSLHLSTLSSQNFRSLILGQNINQKEI